MIVNSENSPKKKIKNFHKENPLIVIGANYRTSTMLLRDRLYIQKADLPSFYERLGYIGFEEIIIISTTDRTEFILTAPQNSHKDLVTEVIKLLSAHVGKARNEIEGQTYILYNLEAIKHVYAIAAALDSLVVGDTKLKEQLRTAHQIARDNNATGQFLDNLILSAQQTETRISRETQINQRPISIAAAAVQVARDVHGELTGSSGLLIGGGEMGEMLASAMRSAGLGNLLVTHPSSIRADTVSQNLNCHVGAIENLDQLLTQSDIIITSINTRNYILSSGILQRAISTRRRKPIFVIDTGVPGDVEPAAEKLEDIFLYTLDDLERVTKEGRKSRAKEAEIAWEIIDVEAKNIITYNKKETKEIDDQNGRIEKIRQEALKESGGDAEKATKLLLNRLKHISNFTVDQ